MANITRTINATNKTPPITVKSHFVCMAKITREIVTTTVIPSANITSHASKNAQVTPSKNDIDKVNNPKNIKLIGLDLLKLSQHAKTIRMTRKTPIATQ